MPEPHVTEDSALVARCRAGDASAWETLVLRYQRLVYAVARRAGLDEQAAADVFQTVFLRLLQQLPRIAQPERLQAWIVTTAKREAWLQRRRGERLVSMTIAEPEGISPFAFSGSAVLGEEWEVADEAPGPDETVAHWQQIAQVQGALEHLDIPCRRLLQALFADDGSSYDQIARRLGVPVGSIGPTRARCLAKLRKALG